MDPESQQSSQTPLQPSDLPKRAKKSSKRKFISILIVAVLVVGLIIAVIVYAMGMDTSKTSYKELRGKEGKDDSGLVIADQEKYEANKAIERGELDDATAIYDDRITAVKDSGAKAQANLDAASAFVDLAPEDKKLKSLEYALAYALAAEKLQPTIGSAGILVQIYTAMGNTQSASEYTTKLEERSKALYENEPSR